MNRRSSITLYIAAIFIIGVVASFLNNRAEFSEMFGVLDGVPVADLLDEVNLFLGLLVLAVLVVFAFYWFYKKDQDQDVKKNLWEGDQEDE
jgi:SNF family Na+-dependent transporter